MAKLVAQNIPQIFDRTVLAHRRRRAAANFANYNFLHQRMADELCTRLAGLAERDQQFQTALLLGSFGGLLASRLRAKAGLIGHIIESDLTPAMLPDKTTRLIIDEQFLPIAPASCDLIISFWGLHHVNDMVGALIQMRHALKQGGLLIGSLAASRTLQNLRTALLAAESDLTGGAVMRVHPFADIADFGNAMQRAKLVAPIIDSDIVTINYAEPMRLLYDLRGMGESNCLMASNMRPLRRDVLAQAMAQLKASHAASNHGKGHVPIDFEICYFMATAPRP